VPQRCKICSSADRAAIEAAMVAGESLREIGARHGVTKDSLHRHATRCVRQAIATRAAERGVRLADRILDEMDDLHEATRRILIEASAGESKDLRTALAAISEARRNVALAARMAGKLDAPEAAGADRSLLTWEEFVVMYRSRRVTEGPAA
jgi:hypothetical protein